MTRGRTTAGIMPLKELTHGYTFASVRLQVAHVLAQT